MVLKRPVGNLSLPRLLRADLARCLSALDKEQRRGEDRKARRRRGSMKETEEEVWYLRNKFLMLCEVLRAHFQVVDRKK